MEIFGKVVKIYTSREGTSQAGNPYQIQTVVLDGGADKVVFEVFGNVEHLTKCSLFVGMEGKAAIKCEASEYNGKYYQRMRMDNPRQDWKPLITSVPRTTSDAVPAAETANQVGAPTEAPKPTQQNDPLPFL